MALASVLSLSRPLPALQLGSEAHGRGRERRCRAGHEGGRGGREGTQGGRGVCWAPVQRGARTHGPRGGSPGFFGVLTPAVTSHTHFSLPGDQETVRASVCFGRALGKAGGHC